MKVAVQAVGRADRRVVGRIRGVGAEAGELAARLTLELITERLDGDLAAPRAFTEVVLVAARVTAHQAAAIHLSRTMVDWVDDTSQPSPLVRR